MGQKEEEKCTDTARQAAITEGSAKFRATEQTRIATAPVQGEANGVG